jgi:Tfp pilus assembly protein PilP
MKAKRKRVHKRNSEAGVILITCLAIVLLVNVSVVSGQVPVVPESASYTYHSRGKPDPFKPAIQPRKETTTKKVTAEKKTVPLTPLEFYSIEKLTLVGITMGRDKSYAMIVDPKGKFYPVTKGTPIGSKEGRVTQILVDQVVVEEQTEDGMGGTQINSVILKLFSESSGDVP